MMTRALAGRHVGAGLLHILIVGGGASGVLLAVQLLRQSTGRVAVTILEKGTMLGCGVAYSTTDPAHLLNTRVVSMSAYPNLPDHFLDWLSVNDPDSADSQGFVSRTTYGRYMQGLLDAWLEHPALTCVQAECIGLDLHMHGVSARLANGEQVEADIAVLATGHALPGAEQDPGLSRPWAERASPCDGPVLIVGCGLTMVDQVLSLLDAGHEGPILAISRRGLLPQVHRPTEPMCWRAEELPAIAGIVPVMQWLRHEIRARVASGGDWRDAVDGLRPHLQTIWQTLPPASRQTFLRHASAWWEVHRHRMPPSSHQRLLAAQTSGQLRMERGRFDGATHDATGRLVAQVRTPDGRLQDVAVARILDCRGIRRDPETHATPLIADLLRAGEARIDPLRLGLDVGPDCAALRRDGSRNERLFAMGPASRAAFWEITAIPDIRVQAERLAGQVLGSVPPSQGGP